MWGETFLSVSPPPEARSLFSVLTRAPSPTLEMYSSPFRSTATDPVTRSRTASAFAAWEASNLPDMTTPPSCCRMSSIRSPQRLRDRRRAASIHVTVIDSVHHPLDEMQAETSGPPLLQGGVGPGLRRAS